MILAIDTATRNASLAVYDGALVRAEVTWETADRHTVELMPRIIDLLGQIEVSIDQITGLAVSIGPGSFTGVRVGVAAAKGLAVARELPIVGIRSTDILAAAHVNSKSPMVVVVRAGRGRLIAAPYSKGRNPLTLWHQTGEFTLTTADQLGNDWFRPTTLCGELTAAERESIAVRLGERVLLSSPAMCVRRAGFLAELAWQRIQAGDADDPARLQPIYVAPVLEGRTA
jgi:tRNA threonylcarbamoyladenosine biosynthesis protein TsaB